MRLIDADAFKACMKDALEQTMNAYTDGGEWAQTITEQFCEAIDEQPTIEPNTDTISRQAVLDAIFSEPLYESGMRKRDSDDIVPTIYEKIKALPSSPSRPQWIPCSERLPSKEERKEWIDKNLGGIGYLYPCLVTRYSSINPDRTKNNPYVAKHYYDGEDFVNNGEEVCSEYIVAWMPLPEPYREVE